MERVLASSLNGPEQATKAPPGPNALPHTTSDDDSSRIDREFYLQDDFTLQTVSHHVYALTLVYHRLILIILVLYSQNSCYWLTTIRKGPQAQKIRRWGRRRSHSPNFCCFRSPQEGRGQSSGRRRWTTE